MIALVCDHGGFELMKSIREHLEIKGFEYKDYGTFTPDSCDYPTVAAPAVEAILNGVCDKGIFICGTGIGISIAANRSRGIRAALCTNIFMAEMAREHNDANVLVLGGRVVDCNLAAEIADVFLSTDFSNEEKHKRRIELLSTVITRSH